MKTSNVYKAYDVFRAVAEKADKRRGVLVIGPKDCALLSKGIRVAVDSVPYPGFGCSLPKGVSHKLDGSQVVIHYEACTRPDARQIAQAQYATKVLGRDRQDYHGTLVDAFFHKDKLYVLLAGVLERDRDDNRHGVNFRMMNLDDGSAEKVEILEPAVRIVAKNPLGKGKLKRGVKI